MSATVCFCHGRESGPWGTKIRRLALVAEQFASCMLHARPTVARVGVLLAPGEHAKLVDRLRRRVQGENLPSAYETVLLR